MIYEFRTYNLKTNRLAQYWDRFQEKLPGRLTLSPLAGHFYTEVGPLNQMVAIWPYADLEERTAIRRQAEEQNLWPPDTGDCIVDMVSSIYQPAPFMESFPSGKMGAFYELRIYTYAAETIPELLRIWGQYMPGRQALSPLVGCWYDPWGGANNFVHMWAYDSFAQRLEIRARARREDIWPPPGGPVPVTQQNKILLSAPFSPLQ